MVIEKETYKIRDRKQRVSEKENKWKRQRNIQKDENHRKNRFIEKK